MKSRNYIWQVVAVVLIFCIGFYLGKLPQEDNSPVYSMLESNFVEYQAFHKELNEQFPYSEPDGVAYKGKLDSFFKEKEMEAETLHSALIASIPNEIEWERSDGSTFWQPPTNFAVKESLQKLHPLFPEYRDFICSLREEEWQGGSGRSASVLSCKIYETEKYINLLNFYYGKFVSDPETATEDTN